MKTRTILFLLMVCLIGCVSSKTNVGPEVRADLEAMFGNAICKVRSVDKSFKSVKIIEAGLTHVVVGKINDVDVCSKDVENLVILFQNTLEEDPAIDRNMGPHIFAFIDDNGKRSVMDTKEVIKSGTLSKCPQIYISVRKVQSNEVVKRSSCQQAVK